MKKILLYSFILSVALIFASCRVAVYGPDGRWHHDGNYWDHNINSMEAQAQRLSTDYNVKLVSAMRIITLINSIEPEMELHSANLQEQDVQPLLSLQMPSNESVHKIAAVLNEDDRNIARIMQGYISDSKIERRTSLP